MEKSNVITLLRNLKQFSYNDLENRFSSMEHRITVPPLVKNRFLQYFDDKLSEIFIDEIKNAHDNQDDKIEIEVRGGMAYSEDPRVIIIDHDNKGLSDEEE